MSQPIEAVVFDVGRVLYRWQLSELMAKVIADPDERAFVLEHVVTEAWHFQHDAGRPIAAMTAERIGQFPQYETAIRAYADRFLETIPGPVPGSLEIVEELDASGMPLFAITNFGSEFWDRFCPTAPVFDRFRDIVVSGKEYLVKPDPAIYELAARRFGYAPPAMFFIDDNAANIAAANALGWNTHHFIDAAALRADLTARGLLRA